MKDKIKVLVFGNQQICIDCLNILKKYKNVEIVGVVGCPQPLDDVFEYPSVQKYCSENNYKYFEPEKMDKESYKELKALKPDICLSIYFRKIFPAFFLKLAPGGFINVHNSFLPKNRGPVPTLWVLLNGDKTSGVTLHYIDKGVDTGDLVAQIRFKVPNSMTGYELNTFFMKKGVSLFRSEIANILSGKNKRIPQDHSQATYYGPFRQNMRVINWATQCRLLQNQILAFAKPYLGSLASLLDKNVLVWEARTTTRKKNRLTGPGKIVKVYSNMSFLVSTADGYLHIKKYEVQDLGDLKLSDYIKVGNRFNL